jgi:glycosyltransferase involved in cell wall biosynthesis
MRSSVFSTVDIVMLGSFGVWTRGTLQARGLPLAQALTKSTNLKIAIVTTPWDDPDQAGVRETIEGVAIYNTHAINPLQTPRVVKEQLDLVRALKPALIHVMKPKASAGLTADVLSRSEARPRLIVDHDDWEGDGGWNDQSPYPLLARRLFAYQEKRLLHIADAVTAASTLLEGRARELRGGSSETEVVYLPNGLDDAWRNRLRQSAVQSKQSEFPRMVLYSRFAEFSNSWLNDVLTRIDRGLTQSIHLHVVGDTDGNWNPENLHQIRVVRHGYLERQEIPEILGAATVALYPYDDNLINRSKQSVKLLELMAAGCAIVASDVGDIRRVGGAGLSVVQPGDARSFAATILRLIDDSQRSSRLGRMAQERSALFGIDRLADRLSNLYALHGVR